MVPRDFSPLRAGVVQRLAMALGLSGVLWLLIAGVISG